METVIYIILAFGLGYWISTSLMIRRILKDPDTMIKLLEKYKEVKDEEESVPQDNLFKDQTILNIERIEGSYYAYAQDGKFLAQGGDFRSMFENIKNAYPEKSFKIEKYQPNLTEEETGKLVKSVLEVFNDNSSKKS